MAHEVGPLVDMAQVASNIGQGLIPSQPALLHPILHMPTAIRVVRHETAGRSCILDGTKLLRRGLVMVLMMLKLVRSSMSSRVQHGETAWVIIHRQFLLAGEVEVMVRSSTVVISRLCRVTSGVSCTALLAYKLRWL